MKKFKAAVLGHPLGHTMSPFIHEKLFGLSGIEAEYRTLDAPDLDAALSELKEFDGFNVTIPYKEKIIQHLDSTDEKAKVSGSVNTVRISGGQMEGFTTDGEGFFRAVAEDGHALGRKMLLLGNGGAARAIAFEAVFRDPEAEITVVCRESSADKARRLTDQLRSLSEKGVFKSTTYDETEHENDKFDILVNATSVGMYPNAGKSPISLGVVKRCGAVFDAVYNPYRTELIKTADKACIRTVGGMGMLVYQAVAAHVIWYGASFRQEDISEVVREADKEMKRIFSL